MLKSELIARLNTIPGDPTVVTGLGRSGYGEPVTDVEVMIATRMADGEEEEVIELTLDRSCTHAKYK